MSAPASSQSALPQSGRFDPWTFADLQHEYLHAAAQHARATDSASSLGASGMYAAVKLARAHRAHAHAYALHFSVFEFMYMCMFVYAFSINIYIYLNVIIYINA